MVKKKLGAGGKTADVLRRHKVGSAPKICDEIGFFSYWLPCLRARR